MATTQAIVAHGTIVEIGLGSPLTWSPIAEVVSIDGFEITRKIMDATHLTSDDNRHEKIAGEVESVMISFTANLLMQDAVQWAGSTGLRDIVDTLSGQLDMRLTTPAGGTVWSFKFWPGPLQRSAQTGEPLRVTFELPMTGKVTIV